MYIYIYISIYIYTYTYIYIYISLSRGGYHQPPQTSIQEGSNHHPPHLQTGLPGTPAALTPMGPSGYPNRRGSSMGDPGTSIILSFFQVCVKTSTSKGGENLKASIFHKKTNNLFSAIYQTSYTSTQRSPTWHLHLIIWHALNQFINSAGAQLASDLHVGLHNGCERQREEGGKYEPP